MNSAQALMVLGTSPRSAKSVLTIALSRALANKGGRVCPFKAVSVVHGNGGGREKTPPDHGLHHQCRAARISFETAMNPVVVKADEPLSGELFLNGEMVSSVSLLNEDSVLTDQLAPSLRERIVQGVRSAYALLRTKYDFIIIEGAGSPVDLPAEEDLPNILVARLAAVPVVFSCKFSRGGGAAALVGSVSCLPPDVRKLVVGFTFSDVQGEAGLEHSVSLVRAHLGIPYLGSVPRVPLWTEQVDSYELLAHTISENLDWNAMRIADVVF